MATQTNGNSTATHNGKSTENEDLRQTNKELQAKIEQLRNQVRIFRIDDNHEIA